MPCCSLADNANRNFRSHLGPHESAIQQQLPICRLRLSATITESRTSTTQSLAFRQRVLVTSMWSQSITSPLLIMRPSLLAIFRSAIVMRTGLLWISKLMGGILMLFRLVILGIRLKYNFVSSYSPIYWHDPRFDKSRATNHFAIAPQIICACC
jgi:hypothetical protein